MGSSDACRLFLLDLPCGKRLGHLFPLTRPPLPLSKEAQVAPGSPDGQEVKGRQEPSPVDVNL